MVSISNENEILSQAALDQLNYYFSESRLPQPQSEIAVVAWPNIEIDSTLGCGSFCRVYEVEVCSTDLLKGKYALKCLNRKILFGEERSVREAGCIDLAVEAHLLSRLNHENIIKLQGRSPNFITNSNCQDWAEKGFFLLLDILEDTLKLRLNLLRLNGSHLTSAMMQRVTDIAVGVAKGLQHLHENNIVLRDLKPANVGFNKDGVPKIFDLGLAREINTLKPKEVAGSLRYMSPEVALGQGASTKSDIYSFGVLLWEITTLGKPFDQIAHTKKDFYTKVIKGSWRPSVTPSVSMMIPPGLAQLIAACWDSDPDKRPGIKQVLAVLKMEELAFCRSSESRRPSSFRKLLKKSVSASQLFSVKKLCKNIGDSLNSVGTSQTSHTSSTDDSRHASIQWSSRTFVKW
jgi:serine/threonine protein kinase